jgi:hypothetical protein
VRAASSPDIREWGGGEARGSAGGLDDAEMGTRVGASRYIAGSPRNRRPEQAFTAMTMLAQVAAEYGALTARNFVLNVKQQVAALGSVTLLIFGAVVFVLWLLLKRT